MTTKILGNQITSYTINTEQLSNTATAAFAKTLAPKILYANVASNTYTILDDTAVNVGGGYIVVTGAEFQSGATVLVDTTQASAVTYVNSTTLRAQVPAKSASSYNLYVVNPDGGTGLKVAGITYSASPTWVTTSPLANVLSNVAFSGSFSATGASSYSNTTVLPTGFTLLANGYYYGNVSVGTETTYNFTIRATDAEAQDSDKDFSLTTVMAIPFTTEYLVVAGGGSGGGRGDISGVGGGGGAGGYLAGNTTMQVGQVYTITVGAGGALAPSPSASGGRGGYSNVSLSGAVVLSATGGGGGGNGNPANANKDGGSGGGAGWGGAPNGTNPMPNSDTTAGTGTPGQGFPGGSSAGQWDGRRAGGGGGGANAAGGNAFVGPNSGGGGGGAGKTWTYNATTYAGGGGGGVQNDNASGSPGPGGAGGGGPGQGGAGGTNTGGGGGGCGRDTTAYVGGSGIVIFAVPTPNYPGSAPGATVTTPPAAPGKTVITFTSSGTYTA